LALVELKKPFAKKNPTQAGTRYVLRRVLQDLCFKDILPSVTYIVGLVSGTATRPIIIAELLQAEPHNHHGKEKETHELIFSWLSWLAVFLVF